MKANIALITILTDHVPNMLDFYQNALGFKVAVNLGQYVELENEGVRFAICDRDVMVKSIHHESYTRAASGQAFELAFPCDTPDDVDVSYNQLIEHGAKPIQAPASMPWGQRTAFFADPEGYIHEIFSELPKK
jgi:lactoylglutathione lyase